jgi:anthranilate phosphoribosyltransferase
VADSIEGTRAGPPPARHGLAADKPAELHPFAKYLRIVARGETRSRPLDDAEAAEAMRMVLRGEAEPVQIGAFLAVLRFRQETADEIAGFVRAARALRQPAGGAKAGTAGLDWPSYADAHRQLPYFVLAALLIAEAGTPVLMHGIEGSGPATTVAALAALGISLCATPDAAVRALERERFAYLPLGVACPPLRRLFALRPLIGLRTGANTIARELNPFGAPYQMQGVFHPNYIEKHRGAAERLRQPHAAIFKGGAGEAQRNPQKTCQVVLLRAGVTSEESWPALADGAPYPWRDEPLEPARVAALWRGTWRAPVPEAAVIGTTALALRLLERAADPAAADRLAVELWQKRPSNKYGRA